METSYWPNKTDLTVSMKVRRIPMGSVGWVGFTDQEMGEGAFKDMGASKVK